MAEVTKLRILCLHGCRQDAKIFNQKTGQFRKILKKIVDFEYVSAPHSISSFDSNDTSSDSRSWWYTSPDRNYSSKTASETDEGFAESVKFLENFIQETGPYDGALAFSQGASFLGIISLMMERGEFKGDFKFLVLVSGFKSPCIPHQKYYTTTVKIPSLHVIGENDQIITRDRSEELMRDHFEKAEVLYHGGGHHLPGSKEEKGTYLDFFGRMLALRGQQSNFNQSPVTS